MKIGLVSCSKQKLDHACPARELYSKSALFRKALAYARAHYDQVFILSAKYGLVHPDQELEPYDQSLNDMDRDAIGTWAWMVYRQMEEAGLLELPDMGLYFHAGKKYRKQLRDFVWANYRGGILIKVPLKGMGIGHQLAFYTKWQEEAASTASWLKWAADRIRHLINIWWWDERTRHPELMEEIKASYKTEYFRTWREFI